MGKVKVTRVCTLDFRDGYYVDAGWGGVRFVDDRLLRSLWEPSGRVDPLALVSAALEKSFYQLAKHFEDRFSKVE